MMKNSILLIISFIVLTSCMKFDEGDEVYVKMHNIKGVITKSEAVSDGKCHHCKEQYTITYTDEKNNSVKQIQPDAGLIVLLDEWYKENKKIYKEKEIRNIIKEEINNVKYGFNITTFFCIIGSFIISMYFTNYINKKINK